VPELWRIVDRNENPKELAEGERKGSVERRHAPKLASSMSERRSD